MAAKQPRPKAAASVAKRPCLPEGSKRLFYYMMISTTMAFFNRAMPTPFLPLILSNEFGLNISVIGLVLAGYPIGALAATSWSCSLARNMQGILKLHRLGIFLMAGAAVLFAICSKLLACLAALLPGTLLIPVLFAAFRAVQGASHAFYIAANTSLITRHFHGAVPYVIGMSEVAVGLGGQTGRLSGGFLYDAGGFLCPFFTVALVQTLCGVAGFAFAVHRSPGCGTETADTKSFEMPLKRLMTPRVAVALGGLFLTYFMSGLFDATLPHHLLDYIGPIRMSTVSIIMSVRSLTYLLVSFACARLLQRRFISFEKLIAVGALSNAIGLLVLAPQPLLRSMVSHLLPPLFGRYFIEIVAIIMSSGGMAMLFVPSLPLMQSEVSHMGRHAEEKMAALFMGGLSLGEATGPILGGLLVAKLGFTLATTVIACLTSLLIVCSLATYDADLIKRRYSFHEDEGNSPGIELHASRVRESLQADLEVKPGTALCTAGRVLTVEGHPQLPGAVADLDAGDLRPAPEAVQTG